MNKLEVTPIKDMKPQLIWISKIMGMDLYIDVRGQSEKKYGIAQATLNLAIYSLNEKKDK